ncbi:ROK family transcriptional regulator [Streptomyces sp. DSM 44915]|uniref:ROK family transcriptional regulator n=1 Tax=Streptomyces chisholmiae TaxID=3075540 RepID=A0ABU2JST6_9ACTN|nr:ROK family transcriptional regulator [Streptomyces sp. DSM 44915]MDT0268051.1 ROK family transcriptional regulator [Streptomyces sp. DSM 44915]
MGEELGTGGAAVAGDAWRSVPRPARPILRELVTSGPQSRTTLARKLGLSTGSLTRLTKPLLDAGLVVERAVEHDPVNGRPTRPLEVVADGAHFLGLKLTADRLYGVVTNLRADVLAQHSVPLADPAPGEVVARIGGLAERLAAGDGRLAAAGLALGGDGHAPAQVDEAELLDSYQLGWTGVPVRRLVADRLGIPCVLKNDVTALAYAHQWFGAVREVPDFALVTVGSGVGYALFVHGREVRVTEADVGEFGHQIVDRGGPMCPTGHRGCVNAYATTGCLLLAAEQGLRRRVGFAELLALAEAGDPVCSALVRQAAWALGRVVANVANVTLVKRVLLAGEAIDIVRLARAELARGLAECRVAPEAVVVTAERHDFHEWARGAAVAAIRAHVSGGR